MKLFIFAIMGKKSNEDSPTLVITERGKQLFKLSNKSLKFKRDMIAIAKNLEFPTLNAYLMFVLRKEHKSHPDKMKVYDDE